MSKYLIVHATRYGQTGKIANFMAHRILASGGSYDLFSVDDNIKDVVPANYQGILVGGAVYQGHFEKKLKAWCKQHHQILNEKPSIFFAVCLGVLQTDLQVQGEERQILQRFLNECLWTPDSSVIFAGALTYSKYNWLVKWMMWIIAKRAGRLTVTSRDYEYTDWAQVEKFVDGFLKVSATSQTENIEIKVQNK
jgi:menaquinone-dependent protoporphyrinogen oxidase